MAREVTSSQRAGFWVATQPFSGAHRDRGSEESPGVRCDTVLSAEVFTPRGLGRVPCVHLPTHTSHFPVAVRIPTLQGRKLRLQEFRGLAGEKKPHSKEMVVLKFEPRALGLLCSFRSAPQLPTALIKTPQSGLLSEVVRIWARNDVAQRCT